MSLQCSLFKMYSQASTLLPLSANNGAILVNWNFIDDLSTCVEANKRILAEDARGGKGIRDIGKFLICSYVSLKRTLNL